MKAEEALRPGLKHEVERVVDDSLLTRHVGGNGVFATPAMIGLMEMTSHKLVEPYLAGGQTTVGYEVHVRHLASSAPGARLRVTSELKEVVDGRKLTFEVACYDGEKLVGSGTHKRAIVAANF